MVLAMVNKSDVEAAAALIEGRVRRTPALTLCSGDLGIPGRLSLPLPGRASGGLRAGHRLAG
jgi:hypothetical protein